eukprot:m.112432 g.112432  ORF g.112432 m.112432 type:complete len:98 (+) comp12786_c2_seq5:1121-1414(+)
MLFASRARKIQNKVVVNQRKKEDSEMHYLRKQIGWMSLELMELREKTQKSEEEMEEEEKEELQQLLRRINSLEQENNLLEAELDHFKNQSSRTCVVL